jgi:hypothetical protein
MLAGHLSSTQSVQFLSMSSWLEVTLRQQQQQDGTKAQNGIIIAIIDSGST